MDKPDHLPVPDEEAILEELHAASAPTPPESVDAIVTPQPLVLHFTLPNVIVWTSYAWARHWFDDAVAVSRDTAAEHVHGLRREIVFAVSFAETYLYEWAFDDVLKRDFIQLQTYFPPGQRRGVTEKYKDIPSSFTRMGVCPLSQKLGTSTLPSGTRSSTIGMA